MVKIPVLIENRLILTADTIARKARLKEALIEAISLARAVISKTKNFLIEDRIFEKKADMEARIAVKPVLMATGILLTADMVSTKNFLTP